MRPRSTHRLIPGARAPATPAQAAAEVTAGDLGAAAVDDLTVALVAMRRAGDLIEGVAYPGGAARSPLRADLAEALFAVLACVADGERNLRRALELAGGHPPAD